MKSTVSTAIILAAGTGNRLFPLTETQPKPLTPVHGCSIVERLVAGLVEVGVTKVAVVVGHLGDQIEARLAAAFPGLDFEFIPNPKYLTTNNIYSLWLTRHLFDRDFLLLESDVVCDVAILAELASRPEGSSACLISPKAFYMDGACVKITGYPPRVTPPEQVPDAEIGSGYYKTVNFYRISSRFASEWLSNHLRQCVESGKLSGYYETAFATAIAAGIEIFDAVITPPTGWFEVDNLNDLDIAEFQLMEPAQREHQLRSRHGGYWRYPVVDHCLLYNFHYPPRKIFAHLAARLDQLVREYPSAQKPIARFLAQYYELPEEMVAVANGVSELIPIVLDGVAAPVIIPTPSFNEYEAVVPPGLLHRFALREKEDFRVDPDRLLDAVARVGAGHIILITPNNPTGDAIDQEALRALIERAQRLGCRVILDESFIDFHPDGRKASFVDRLRDHPNLTILFSLSKSHGIGGLRIGMIASADAAMMDRVRARLPIWNINGFAEEYLRLFSAFRKEYKLACGLTRAETDRLQAALGRIEGVRAFPTASNFVFCRLLPGFGTARELTSRLFETHGIYIKECSGKSMPDAEFFFRVASRGDRENASLVLAIADVLSQRFCNDTLAKVVDDVMPV